VYPYTDEGLVGQAVSLFTRAGLRDGDGVILIISAAHCASIKLRLLTEGINADNYQLAGQLQLQSELASHLLPDQKTLEQGHLGVSDSGGTVVQLRGGYRAFRDRTLERGRVKVRIETLRHRTARIRIPTKSGRCVPAHNVPPDCEMFHAGYRKRFPITLEAIRKSCRWKSFIGTEALIVVTAPR
jgi:hypothetical protein